jgi:hypothetical protein
VASTPPHPTKADEEIKLGEWNLRSGYKKSADIQLNLPEGSYTLKLLNMPDRKCTVVIPKNDQ